MPFAFELIVMVSMIAINAIFAAYEMALASISKAKLLALANLKRRGAKDALYMKEHIEGSLAVVQVGITFLGAISAAVGGAGVEEHLSPMLSQTFNISKDMSDVLSLVFLIIPLSIFTIIFAELIPKTYAIERHTFVCLTLSPFMKVLTRIIYPVIYSLEYIVKFIVRLIDKKHAKNNSEENTDLHELSAAVSLARTSRLLGAREEKIVLSAAMLSTRPIKECMIAVKDICTINLNASLTQALISAHNDMHTRFPVCEIDGDPQTIKGYVNFKDIMAALKLNPSDPSIKGIIRPLQHFQANSMISSVLEQMMSQRLHIALVENSDKKIIGMVTLEDIIEELVGEIEDEFDRLPSYVYPYAGGWIVGGASTIKHIISIIGDNKINVEPHELDMRLADWFSLKIGKVLSGGETVKSGSMQIVARKLRRKKLSEAIIMIDNT